MQTNNIITVKGWVKGNEITDCESFDKFPIVDCYLESKITWFNLLFNNKYNKYMVCKVFDFVLDE